jgi:LysR family glycine cleavage system transcriptional activator
MSKWFPSLNALRAFEAVARHLNYGNAAQELNVSSAAVNQLVHKLERSLGVRLVQRSGRGLSLTARGEAASVGLSQAFRQLSDCVQEMRRPDARERLVVTCDPSFASLWLVPRLEHFKSAYPDMDVLLDSSVRVLDLHSGVADVAVRFAAPPDNSLVSHRLFDEFLCAYCSPRLLEGPHALRCIEDLERAPLLRWDLSRHRSARQTARWNSWEHWLSHVGAEHVKPQGGSQFSDYNLALQAAIAGQGVILGSEPILKGLVETGLLVNPFKAVATTNVGYDLVTTPDLAMKESVRRFCDWVNTLASGDRD